MVDLPMTRRVLENNYGSLEEVHDADLLSSI
jgi:hypothetical protein